MQSDILHDHFDNLHTFSSTQVSIKFSFDNAKVRISYLEIDIAWSPESELEIYTANRNIFRLISDYIYICVCNIAQIDFHVWLYVDTFHWISLKQSYHTKNIEALYTFQKLNVWETRRGIYLWNYILMY